MLNENTPKHNSLDENEKEKASMPFNVFYIGTKHTLQTYVCLYLN